jgi:hypothetical protein
MGFFSRRSAAPDKALPFLSVDEAATVRRLMVEAFAAAGLTAETFDDHLRTDDGREWGLWNVAATCHAEPSQRAWPEAVRRHVESLLTPAPSPEDLTDDEVLAAAVLRVYGDEMLMPRSRAEMTYARELAEGLVEALVLDSPTSVMLLLDSTVARVGADRLRAAGLEHLLAEPWGQVERLTTRAGATLALVEGDSVFTASRVLVMPDTLRRVFGEREYPDGVLVAMPDRHHLWLHPIDDTTVVPALQTLAGNTAQTFATAVGGVSPAVYWWRHGALTRVSALDAEGGVTVSVGPELTEVLNRLAGEG